MAISGFMKEFCGSRAMMLIGSVFIAEVAWSQLLTIFQLELIELMLLELIWHS